jgi:hypothetical protein
MFSHGQAASLIPATSSCGARRDRGPASRRPCRSSSCTAKWRLLLAAGALTVVHIPQASAARETFRATCNEIRYERTAAGQAMVWANCLSYGQTRVFTRLVLPAEGCLEIENRNGRLRCLQSSRPGGSWSRSCFNGRFTRGEVFRADCYGASRQATFGSEVDLSRCPSRRLENISANLRCVP